VIFCILSLYNSYLFLIYTPVFIRNSHSSNPPTSSTIITLFSNPSHNVTSTYHHQTQHDCKPWENTEEYRLSWNYWFSHRNPHQLLTLSQPRDQLPLDTGVLGYGKGWDWRWRGCYSRYSCWESYSCYWTNNQGGSVVWRWRRLCFVC
jgi:hypothetical protein